MRRARLAVATVLTTLLAGWMPALAAGNLARAGGQPTKVIDIAGYAYHPAQVTVHVGETLTWTNDDSAPHTITTASAPVAVDSPQLRRGQSWTFTPVAPGTYHYYCAVHPDMKATFTVLDAVPPATPAARRSPVSGITRARSAQLVTAAVPTPSPTPAPETAGAAAAAAPPRTLDPTLLLVALTVGAVVMSLLALGRRAQRTRQ